MKAIFIALFLLVAVASAANNNRYKYNDDICQLDRNNFDQCQKDFDYFVVKFWSPSCPYSKKYAPEYIKARSVLRGGAYDITFAEVNCKLESALAKKYGVRSYPSTRFFNKRQNKWINYDGKRQSTPLVSWIKKLVDSDRQYRKSNKH